MEDKVNESSVSCLPHTALRAHITSASRLTQAELLPPLPPPQSVPACGSEQLLGALTEPFLLSQADTVVLLHRIQIDYLATQMTTATQTPT